MTILQKLSHSTRFTLLGKFQTIFFARCLITKKEPLLRLTTIISKGEKGAKMENVFMEFMDNRRRHCGVSVNNERCHVMLSAAWRLQVSFMIYPRYYQTNFQ